MENAGFLDDDQVGPSGLVVGDVGAVYHEVGLGSVLIDKEGGLEDQETTFVVGDRGREDRKLLGRQVDVEETILTGDKGIVQDTQTYVSHFNLLSGNTFRRKYG